MKHLATSLAQSTRSSKSLISTKARQLSLGVTFYLRMDFPCFLFFIFPSGTAHHEEELGTVTAARCIAGLPEDDCQVTWVY